MKIAAIFLALVILVTGCTSTTQNQQTIKIGGAFALTGDGVDWGEDELKAVELAIDDANSAGGINGKQIELIIEDTKTENTGTLNAIQKLMTVDRVSVIIGPTWGDSFGAIVAPVGEQNKVVQITPSGALEVAESTIDYPYFFSTYYPQAAEIEKQMEYLKMNNYTNVVVINDQDPFDKIFSELYMQEAGKNGITIKERYEVPLGTKDLRTVITLAKDQNPDVVFLLIQQIAELGSAIKQMKELGMRANLMSSASAQTQNLIDSYGAYAEDSVIYTYPDTSSGAFQEFLNKFKAKYGEEPVSASAGNAYDAARAVIAALKTGATTGEEIKDVLYKIKIPGTIVNEISFTSLGQISDVPFILKTVRGGQFVKVE